MAHYEETEIGRVLVQDNPVTARIFRDATAEERTSVNNYIKSISHELITLDAEEIENVLNIRDDCKYCENETDIRLDYIANWTDLRMERSSGKSKIVAYGDDVAEVEINFCPFCGRQLNSEYKRIR